MGALNDADRGLRNADESGKGVPGHTLSAGQSASLLLHYNRILIGTVIRLKSERLERMMKKRFYLAAAGLILAPPTAATLMAIDATIDSALGRAAQRQQSSQPDTARLSDALKQGLIDEGLTNNVQSLVADTQVLEDAVASMY
jgi:hypothetical protein